jgi:hypothetical protein
MKHYTAVNWKRQYFTIVHSDQSYATQWSELRHWYWLIKWMHNEDANFKTLALRVLSLEQNIRKFILFNNTSRTLQVCTVCMSSMYSTYVQYVCQVCTARMYNTHSSRIERGYYLFLRALKNLLLIQYID